MDANECGYKPHAVCFPCPGQSHLNAMLQLAKLLHHHKGFHITFVNFENVHKRCLESSGHKNSSEEEYGFPSFRFETLPDSLLHQSQQGVYSFRKSVRNNMMLDKFLDLLTKLNDSSSTNGNQPAVSCIISDGFMPFTIEAAQQLGLPVVMFLTISACSFMGYKQFRTLKEKGLVPLKDDSCFIGEYLDTVIDWIPGMKGIRIKDLPSFARITDPNDHMFNFTLDSAEVASKASGIIFHTFDALEGQVLDALSAMFPNLFTIGPLQLLLNQKEEQNGRLNSIGYNLWKEETECLQWLDSKEPNSVIYVNFGSAIVVKKQQFIEVAMGLANSNHPFLWIIRPDLVAGGGDTTVLPSEFEAKAKGKGFIASWCPQMEVLNHPSVGGFLTHSGWGSTIESLSAGVPMICWPFEGDQMTNCRYTCKEWGVGMQINGDEDGIRNEVQKSVRELLEGEKGKQMRNKASEWKKLAEEAVAPDGSSSKNLEKLVNEILLPKEHIPAEI